MDKLAKELAEKGWFEIEYDGSYKKVLEKGDLLISTDMGMFDGFSNDIRLAENFDEIVSDEHLFTVINFSDTCIQYFPMPGEDGWYEVNGRVFVKKKQTVEYVTVEVPKYLLSEILNMEGRIK